MPQTLSTIIVFVPFVIIAVGVTLLVLFWIYDLIRPLIDNFAASESGSFLRALRSRLPHLGGRGHDGDDEAEDLDDDTATLLSMLPTASVVVDRSDEVVRASPSAYTLDVVDEFGIRNDEILAAVRQVRESGGRRMLDVTTSTSERLAAVNDVPVDAGEEDGARRPGRPAPVEVYGVSRSNWLKITVGRINEWFVVVLIDDVSDAVRFAQTRDSFITNVSEQLLKPTDALIRLSDSLQNDAMDAEQVAWSAHTVSDACGKLNRMVSDLLLLIQAQEPITPSSANRLNVMDQLRSVCEARQDDARKLGVRLNVDGDDTLTVNGDSAQIRAAIAKLVDNALVYSNRGGLVNVSAERSPDDAQALIRVVDQGVGIGKSEQSRIFERFYRGGNQTPQSHDGIGLGLAIVKHVALTHHGGVTVWSSPGSGSTFSLILPLAL